MDLKKGPIVAIVALVAMSGGAAANAEVSCPASVAVEQKAGAPKEWSVDYSSASAELSSVTIFDGPPAEQASLKYDDEQTTKDQIVQTWQLPASERGYWIVCGYSNTTTQLRRKLPNDLHACEVVFEKGVSFAGGGMVVKRARCDAGKAEH